MAYYSSKGKSNDDLIDQLSNKDIIKSQAVIAAMKKVDRADFSPSDPYDDCPQRIGYGATISAPHMHAHALDELKDKLKPGCSALDVGSGSGYLVACMAYMVGDKGTVVGIEHIKELYDLGKKNINKSHSHLLIGQKKKKKDSSKDNDDNKDKDNDNDNDCDDPVVTLVKGDGRKGYLPKAPYDCIHVGAAAQPDVPDVLAAQLKKGGKMVIPVEIKDNYSGTKQVFRMYNKSNDEKETVTWKDIMGVRYVPLTDEQSQRRGKK
eukprot:CAMPEP_0201575494 /NCGR_PEP_ID=MMETSP0190_2-20130828/20713_1 /ASSEMBLY_ACC=CAM_ASM_000263 /TAXON_ID=37353 /ORGANISM="Rosalina sp." /LENGTH=263 /DNA_ID=CAMNT_0048005173 /DNA_START=23 /DNA_END=814 /DNA_ORIENTATION=-